MAWFDRLRNTILDRGSVNRDIADELQFHIDAAADELIAQGVDPAEARAQAYRRFGGRSRVTEEVRDSDTLAWLDGLARDLRIAARGLARRPGMTATIVLSLGVGIGATTAMFSVVDQVLLRPLPLPDPDRLVTLIETHNGNTGNGNPQRLADWNSRVPAFAAVMGLYGDQVALEGGDGAERVSALCVFGRPFDVLGHAPVIGRVATPEEIRNGDPVAVLSRTFWTRRFGADPNVLGRAITLGGRTYTVIGVYPQTLDPSDDEVVIPAPPGVQKSPRSAGFLYMVARLAPAVSIEQAQAQAATVATSLARIYPETDQGLAVRLTPLAEDRSSDARQPLLLLLATVAAVLLIACVNVSGLLLARSIERQRESAVRLALGAGRASLIRLQLAESLVLALAGGLL